MTDIIRKSGVSRSGVYKNYKNKDEILLEIFKEPIDEVFAALGDSIFNNLELAFRTGKKHEESIKTIIDAGLEHSFLDRMNERYDSVDQSFYISLWNGMVYNALIQWAKSGMEGSVDETIEKLKQGLKQVAEAIETGFNARSQNHNTK